MAFKILGVDHIGVAVNDLEETQNFWTPIAKFIEKNGGRGGIQHIALRVDDLPAAIADLQEKGIKMIDTKPRKGAGGADIAFVHPKSTYGVLLELCQHEDR